VDKTKQRGEIHVFKLPAASAAVLLLALGATACKKAEAPADSAEGTAAAPAAAAPAAPAATAAAGEGDTKYQCTNGVVPVSYKAGTATVTLKDKVLELKVDPANAERFVGTGVEWWTNGRGQGATANLYSQTPEGTAGDVLEGCVENPQA
jgi:hypothetical protein